MKYSKHIFALAILALTACGGGGGDSTLPPNTPIIPVVQPSTDVGLNGRLIMGYQGWFGCPGDFGSNTSWIHWFNGTPAADHLLVDMLPSVDALPSTDLCDTGLKKQNGKPLLLFSAQNKNVVDYHFRLMAQQGVGGVAVQRFVNQLQYPELKARLNNVLLNAITAAEKNNIPFFITYDVSGADPSTVIRNIRNDWRELQGTMKITDSSQYLRDSGKPVLQLWGFGFDNHPGTPVEVSSLLSDLKTGADQLKAVTTIGGVPADWRNNPVWYSTYLQFDVLSPWTVGRFDNTAGVDNFFNTTMAHDISTTNANKIKYLPVIFPGFSWVNLMHQYGKTSVVNQIPRSCGNFITHQVEVLVRNKVNMAYGAMFDEMDESTSMLPMEPLKSGFPLNAQGVYLNIDGCDLAPDWYVTVMGQLAAKFTR